MSKAGLYPWALSARVEAARGGRLYDQVRSRESGRTEDGAGSREAANGRHGS